MDWLHPARGKGAVKALPHSVEGSAIACQDHYANLELQAGQKWALVRVWACGKIFLEFGPVCEILWHVHS